MRKKHSETSPRLEIGAPFARMLDELLKATNTGSLSPKWNRTDMARYAIAELWKRTGEPVPRDAEALLPHFWKDLDV